MFQEDDTTRKFLHVVRLYWSLPGPPRPENCFPDFWCLRKACLDEHKPTHKQTNFIRVVTWYHFAVQRKGRGSSRQEWRCVFYLSSSDAHSLTSASGRQAVIFLSWSSSEKGEFKPSAPLSTLFSVHHSSRLTAVNPSHEQRRDDDKGIG